MHFYFVHRTSLLLAGSCLVQQCGGN
jgi:hypothetical protein